MPPKRKVPTSNNKTKEVGKKKPAPRKAGGAKEKKKFTTDIKRGSPNKKTRSSAGKGKPQQSKKNPTAEDLDKDMDNYWIKSGKAEVVNKKLDDEMDAYWANKKPAAAEAEEKTG